jgi:hypothetical protein
MTGQKWYFLRQIENRLDFLFGGPFKLDLRIQIKLIFAHIPLRMIV